MIEGERKGAVLGGWGSGDIWEELGEGKHNQKHNEKICFQS